LRESTEVSACVLAGWSRVAGADRADARVSSLESLRGGELAEADRVKRRLAPTIRFARVLLDLRCMWISFPSGILNPLRERADPNGKPDDD
jgi:hypothetical protein